MIKCISNKQEPYAQLFEGDEEKSPILLNTVKVIVVRVLKAKEEKENIAMLADNFYIQRCFSVTSSRI